MTAASTAPAPVGDLASFAAQTFTHDGVAHRVPQGRRPCRHRDHRDARHLRQVLGFADRVVALGCTAVLPDLFGTAGRDPLVGGLTERVAGLRTIVGACVSREFTVLATGRPHLSPAGCVLSRPGSMSGVVARGRRRGDVFLRRVRAGYGGRPGGGRTGVVPAVVALAGEPVAQAHDRLRRSGPGRRRPALRPWPAVLGLRFDGDPFVPAERFAFLRERLGDGFIAVELRQEDGQPSEPLPRHHSVLTLGLIDEPGEPTRAALDQVLDLFANQLGLR